MKLNSRLGAFTTHLMISGLILVILLSVIFFVWYPNGLIIAGGLTGLKILIGVDLILGPVLTLIVFSPGKKGLKFDLTLIAVLQIACLLYGLWTIHSQRPLAQVLINDGVHLLSAADIKRYEVDLTSISGNHPKKVYMKLPEDESTWSTVIFTSELIDEKPFAFRDDLYRNLGDFTDQDYHHRIATIIKNNPIQGTSDFDSNNCKWIPIVSTHTTSYACFSKKNGIEMLSSKDEL